MMLKYRIVKGYNYKILDLSTFELYKIQLWNPVRTSTNTRTLVASIGVRMNKEQRALTYDIVFF